MCCTTRIPMFLVSTVMQDFFIISSRNHGRAQVTHLLLGAEGLLALQRLGVDPRLGCGSFSVRSPWSGLG